MTTEKILRSSREETRMVPLNIRVHLPILFVLFALITLSTLAMFSLLVSSARSASAAPARLVQADAVVAASPTNLTNCRQCMVTVINKSADRTLTWFAISRGIPGVTIKPTRGMLQPKKQVSVNITMPSNITCPANDTITFTGPKNSVDIAWNCTVTSTQTPVVTLTPTPTVSPTPSPTPTAIPTQTSTSLTPTATSVPNGGVQQNNGNPPIGSSSQGSSVPSILLSVAALLLALLACTLYLIPSAKASLRHRLLSLILPVSFLRRLDQNH